MDIKLLEDLEEALKDITGEKARVLLYKIEGAKGAYLDVAQRGEYIVKNNLAQARHLEIIEELLTNKKQKAKGEV